MTAGTTWTHQELLSSVMLGPSAQLLREHRAPCRRSTTRYKQLHLNISLACFQVKIAAIMHVYQSVVSKYFIRDISTQNIHSIGSLRKEFFLCLWSFFVPFSIFNLQSMTLKDAIKSSLTILKQVMEEKLNATNIEVRFFLSHPVFKHWIRIQYCSGC